MQVTPNLYFSFITATIILCGVSFDSLLFIMSESLDHYELRVRDLTTNMLELSNTL